MLTDGQQDAPASSAYRSTGSPAWQTLKSRAAALKKTWLGAYALPLAAQTGAALLQKVIPSTVVLEPGNAAALSRYLDQSKQATRLAKARSLIAGDLGKGVRMTWTQTRSDPSAGTATLHVDLTAMTRRVPLTVSGLRVRVIDGVTLSGSLPQMVNLAPGQTRSFVLQAQQERSFSLELWPHRVTTSAPMPVSGRVDSPWAEALSPDITLKLPEQLRNTGDIHVSHQAGSWRAVGIAGGVAALLLLVFALAFYLHAFPPLPAGAIGIYKVDVRSGAGFRRVDQFPISRRRSRQVSQAANATVKMRGRRVPASTLTIGHIGHIGMEATVVRNDSRGTSRHILASGDGALIGGFYLLHVRSGEDVPALLRINASRYDSAHDSPWETWEPAEDRLDAAGDDGVSDASHWTDDPGATPVPASGNSSA